MVFSCTPAQSWRNFQLEARLRRHGGEWFPYISIFNVIANHGYFRYNGTHSCLRATVLSVLFTNGSVSGGKQMDYLRLGQRIRRQRKLMGLTQKEVAERAGISLPFYGHIAFAGFPGRYDQTAGVRRQSFRAQPRAFNGHCWRAARTRRQPRLRRTMGLGKEEQTLTFRWASVPYRHDHSSRRSMRYLTALRFCKPA